MKVFLTGATGLVGAHTARELISHGHEVRFLLRDLKLAQNYFGKFGISVDDYVISDMRNQQTVEEAMRGCDAVLHAAASVGLASKQAKEVYRNNLDGVRSIIGTAIDLEIEKIVYVSSLSVLFCPNSELIDESSPIGQLQESYASSKIACEKYVRSCQKDGASIQISYPGGVFGPDDPRLNETNRALQTFITKCLPITSSGLQVVDARDLARAHRLMLERVNPPSSDGRFILAGHFYPWNDLRDLLEGIVHRRLRCAKLPGAVFRFAGFVCDLIKRIYPFDFPMTSESMMVVTRWVPASSKKALEELGLHFRSAEETFHDTIKWLGVKYNQ